MLNGIKTRIILLIVGLSTLSACSLIEINEQVDVIEGTGILHGKVVVKSRQKGPVVVVKYRTDGRTLIRENEIVASSKGEYQFGVLPGKYTVFAFIDVNKDGQFQLGKEHGQYHPGPLFYQVNPKETVKVKELIIKGDPPVPSYDMKVVTRKDKIVKNIGNVIQLNSPHFGRENYSMGMWRPIDFLEKVDAGLLMLQKYDHKKIPIIYVHGMNGGPTDFEKLISTLDKRRYQPWILYYPSGLRLDMVSDYFVQAVKELEHRYSIKKFSVVAHSMGGLVTRSFIKKYSQQFPRDVKKINMVMTINSPMNGMASAASGVRNSPIVVPAWRDVAADSKFINDLYSWNWPKKIPYYVVFSYEDDEGDDGVVEIRSQLPFKLQTESIRMYGFNNSHVGTLSDKKFIKLFNSLMVKHSQ